MTNGKPSPFRGIFLIGLVLQFIGDEIEAVFGAPLELEHHPVAAARAALEMYERSDCIQARSWPQILEVLRGSRMPWWVTPLIWPPDSRA